MKQNRLAWAAMWLLTGSALILRADPPKAPTLKLGDAAPELSPAKWLQGEAVNPAKAPAEDVFLIEFWATWWAPCRYSIGHLSELQSKYKDRRLTVIGVTNESEETVKPFLQTSVGKKLDYRLALDTERKASAAWMDAAGAEGIPTAFLVKGGRIAWIGHPEGALDGELKRLIEDPDFFVNLEAMSKLRQRYDNAIQAMQWSDAVAVGEEMLKLRPKDDELLFEQYEILATRLQDKDASVRCGRRFVDCCESAHLLNEFAWYLLTEKDYEKVRDLSLAYDGAKKALDLCRAENAAIVDTYARALADTGRLGEALDWQKKAVSICNDPQMLEELQDTLEGYQRKAAAGI